LTLRTALPLPKYEAVAQRHLFFDRVLEEVFHVAYFHAVSGGAGPAT
jgi:hypothetical protein